MKFNVTIAATSYYHVEVDAMDENHAQAVAKAIFDNEEGLSLFEKSPNIDYGGGVIQDEAGNQWFVHEGEEWDPFIYSR